MNRQLQVIENLVKTLIARPSVERVILFGSRARGDAGERSDIDLAVEAPRAATREWLDIVESVEEAETLLAVDLVRMEESSAEFRARIEEEGAVLYDRSKT